MANEKKQVPLRLSKELYNSLNAWAKDDFRSLNGQIEYLLTACIRTREKTGQLTPDRFDPTEPLAVNLDDPTSENK